MIVEHYPSPKIVSPTLSYFKKSFSPLGANGMPSSFNQHHAKRFCISEEEFIRRDQIIRAIAEKAHHLQVGFTYFPYTHAAMLKHGECKVTCIYRSYGDFNKSDVWDEKQAHFIVTARDKSGEIVVCTPGYLQSHAPKEADA